MNLRIEPTSTPGEFVIMDTDWIGDHEVFRGSHEECYEYLNPKTTPDWIHNIRQLNDKI